MYGLKGRELVSEIVRKDYGLYVPKQRCEVQLPYGFIVPDDCVLFLPGPQFINDDGKLIDYSGLHPTTFSDSGGTIQEDLDTTETAIDFLGGSFSIGDTLRIDNEQMLLTNIAIGILTVIRAINGTTPATHATGTAIYKATAFSANHGTITGATWIREPSGVKSLSFVTDDYVDCGSNASLYPTAALTLLAWVYINNDSAVGTFPRIVSCIGAEVKGYEIFQPESGHQISYTIYCGGAGGWRQEIVGTPSLDTWCLAGFTYDSATIISYLNGVAGAPNAQAGPIVYPDVKQSLRLGLNPSIGSAFDGKIVLVRILSSVLTASQMLAIFEQERHLFGV